MATKNFTAEEARAVGVQIGIDFDELDLGQFRRGLEVEMEHGSQWGQETNVTNDDRITTGKIVWAHLKEIKDYYTRLDKMEAEAEGK